MNGTDPAVSLGAVELTFRRTMIGYVDRLGGYRMVLWMLVGLAPLFLVSFIIGQTHAPKWVHLVVIPRCPQLPGSGLDRSRRVRHGGASRQRGHYAPGRPRPRGRWGQAEKEGASAISRRPVLGTGPDWVPRPAVFQPSLPNWAMVDGCAGVVR